MNITQLTAWTVKVPILTEWMSSPEFGAHVETPVSTILRLSDADGNEGWSECSGDQLPALEPVANRLLGNCLADLRPNLLDLWGGGESYWSRPVAPSPFSPDPSNLRHRLRHPLQEPVECALTDLMARRLQVPVSQFFGGRWRDSVPSDYWAGRVTPEQAARCARRGQELGFTGIKIKAALEDPNVERLEAIRDATDSTFGVTVDPNGRFHRLDDAWRTIQAMDRVGNLRTLEDPFPRFHLPEFAALRERINARVVVHIDPIESLWTVILSGAAGGLNIDSRQVGPSQWRILAGVAEQANLSIWHAGGHDLGIKTAWHLQLSASAPNCRLPGDQTGPWLREHTLIKQPFHVADGGVAVPSGPGLGVDADLDALDLYCQNQRTWKI